MCGINMLKSAALRSACSVFGVIRAGGIYGHSCNVRTFGIVVLSGELMGNVTVCLIFYLIWSRNSLSSALSFGFVGRSQEC